MEEKTYKPEFNQDELSIILNLFNTAVKVNGLAGDFDLQARAIINKIVAAEIKLNEE